MELPNEREDLIKLAKAQGWTVDRTTKGHVKFQNPQKQCAVGSGTPSDYRADKNLRARLKRLGLQAEVKPVEKPVEPLRTPQIVIDKSQLALGASSVTPLPPGPDASFREVTLWALRKVNRGGGMEVDDIFAHVAAKRPTTTRKQLGVHLAELNNIGWITRTEPGRYAIVEGFVPPPPKSKGGNKRKPKVIAGMDDAAILERALGVLAELDSLVRRHKLIAEKFAGLQELLGKEK